MLPAQEPEDEDVILVKFVVGADGNQVAKLKCKFRRGNEKYDDQREIEQKHPFLDYYYYYLFIFKIQALPCFFFFSCQTKKYLKSSNHYSLRSKALLLVRQSSWHSNTCGKMETYCCLHMIMTMILAACVFMRSTHSSITRKAH